MADSQDGVGPKDGVTNPWLDRRVLCYAHQGGAKEAPSSTLAAMNQAVEAGANALELDLHATSDGHIVCCHDETVDRTTDGVGVIAEMTLEEVRQLDAAWWFSEGEGAKSGLPIDRYFLRGRATHDTSYRIPTLIEVLQSFPNVALNFDIKRTEPDVRPYEGVVAALIRKADRVDDVIVGSFHQHSLDILTNSYPDIQTSASPSEIAQLWQALLLGTRLPQFGRAAFQVPLMLAGVEIPTQKFVSAIHQLEAAVHVWTVDDMDVVTRLVGTGVDGIITDVPKAVASRLNELGVLYSKNS